MSIHYNAPIAFSDPRLNLSPLGSFLVRLASYTTYAFLSASAVFALVSELTFLRWAGILLLLFLGDRLLHIGKGEVALDELARNGGNIAKTMAPAAFRALEYAFRKSTLMRTSTYLVLLEELASRRDIAASLRRLDIDPVRFSEAVSRSLRETKETPRIADSAIQKLCLIAYESARSTNERYLEPRNIFAALTAVPDPSLVALFEKFNVSVSDMQEVIIFGKWQRAMGGLRRLPATLGAFAHRPRFLRHRVMDRAWTARPTPLLDRLSTDLTDLARAEKVGLLIGHDREFDHMVQILSRPGKPNALLVGEPGSGKSTIVARLAFRIIKDQVPDPLFDKRLVSLDIGTLIANAPLETLSSRLRAVIDEIIHAGNIILFIPNMHDLFRTASVQGLNAIDVLLPVIQNSSVPVIGETYQREFKQYIEPRSDFLDQFEVVPVEEITEAEAVRFLIYSSILLERQFRATVTFRALVRAVALAKRYFRNKLLPGSALDLVKEALVKIHSEHGNVVDEQAIVAVAERKSKIPIQEAQGEEAERLLNLEERIHRRFVNQEAAVSSVSRALREYRSGLSRQGGPIAAFLFVGPTGVGKTELAKTIAEIQFGSRETIERFDMSEFQDKQSIFRFIGTPDGSKSGALTDAVFARPYSVVLLDEFEKAHPDILNLFLQVFDDGRLTDGANRTVSFEHTILIATSNAHSDFIQKQLEEGKTMDAIADELKRKLTQYFKPELLNRFSDISVFRSLNREEILLITRLMLDDIVTLLHETRGVELQVDPEALRAIADLGYSPVFGARPLRQVISEKVKSVLAEKILRNEIHRGNRIRVRYSGGSFSLDQIVS